MRLSKAFIASASIGLIALFVLPGQEGAYRLSKWGISGFALLVLSGGFLFSLRKSPALFVPRERTFFLAGAAFLASAILLPISSTPFMTAHLAGALRLLMGFSFAYLTALAFDGQPAVKRQGLKVISAMGGLCACIVILQAAGLDILANTFFTSAEFRSPGTFGNPNWAAAFLLPLAPLSLALTRTSADRREKKVYAFITLLITVGTFATLSKAGILALIGGMTAYFLFDHKIASPVRRRIVSAIVLIVLAVLVFAFMNGSLFTLPWMRGRLFLWEGALLLIAGHPVAGVGLGGYLPLYPQAAVSIIHGDPNAFMPLDTISFMHNDVLQMAVEGGLPTALLYLSLIAWALYLSYRRNEDLSQGVGAAIAGLFLYGLADSPFQLPATFMLFWFLLGWMMSGSKNSASGNEYKENLPRHRLKIAGFLGVLVIIALLAFTQGIRFTVGDLLWSKGKLLLSQQKAFGIEALQMATGFLPDVGQVRSDYAKALARSGRTSEALRELDAARNVYFNFDNVFLQLELLRRTGDRTTAITGWQKLSGDFPGLVTPHFKLGLLYLEDKSFGPAIAEFQQVLKLDQKSKQAALYREKARQILKTVAAAGFSDNLPLTAPPMGTD